MLESMCREEIKCNREMRAYGDRMMQAISGAYESMNFEGIYQVTDRLLQIGLALTDPDKFRSAFSALLRSEDFERAYQWDDNLILLRELILLYEVEGEAGESREAMPLLERVSSFEELLMLCRKVIFCLRRVELNLPEEECNGIFYFMEEWGVSAMCIIVLLRYAGIWDKPYTAARLGRLLQKNGFPVEGRQLLAWAESQ